MKKSLIKICAVAGILALPLLAHHSFAMYD